MLTDPQAAVRVRLAHVGEQRLAAGVAGEGEGLGALVRHSILSSFLVVEPDTSASDDDTEFMAKALPPDRAVMTAKQIRSRVRRRGERFWRPTNFPDPPPAAVSQALRAWRSGASWSASARVSTTGPARPCSARAVRRPTRSQCTAPEAACTQPASAPPSTSASRPRIRLAPSTLRQQLRLRAHSPARMCTRVAHATAKTSVSARVPSWRCCATARARAISTPRARVRGCSTSSTTGEPSSAWRRLPLMSHRACARCSAPPASSSGWTSMCLDDSEPASTRSRATTSAPSADACRLPTAGRQRGEEISLSPSDLSRAWRCTNGSTMLLFHSNLAPAMMRSRPEYELAEVACLARERRVIATRRVVGWLMNHDYDAAETLIDVLTSLEINGRWVGSAELKNGEVADAYVVAWSDEDWYVKFYVDGAEIVVNVWSCCWDGAVH